MWRTKERPGPYVRAFLTFYAGERVLKTYCKPLKRGASWRSQNFGDNATKYGPHSGNDEACPVGTPVHAAGDGVIEWAGEFDDSYADNLYWLLIMGGNVAVLNCGDDEPTFIYAHLSTFYVRPGDRVKKGQVIALSGNSGYATTGAHLHVEAIPPGYVLNSYLLGRVNPDKYLTEWPESVITVQAQSIVEEVDMATPQEIWDYKLTLDDKEYAASDILIYARKNADYAKWNGETAAVNTQAIIETLKTLGPEIAAELEKNIAKASAEAIAGSLKIVATK